MKTQTQDDGGPAFPKRETLMRSGFLGTNIGDMTLRDVFAAVAMHALISRGHDALNIGRKAFIAADDMLAARKGGES